MFNLSGKTALVTGATGGIGGSIARALHAQGATVALSGTRKEVLEQLAAELGERAFVVPADLSSAESVEALVPAAEAAMGSVDILVNNAGLTRDGLFMRMKDEDWDLVLRVNLGTDCHHYIRGRHDRKSGAGQLCRVQSGACRYVQSTGCGSRQPERDGQLRGAWFHRNPDDRCAQ